MSVNPLAAELNDRLARRAPAVLRMLSARGRAAYFPYKGILGQSAEARGKHINATIGIALEDDGSPLCLPGLAEMVELSPADAFTYAPSFGKPELRDRWRAMLREKNPALAGVPLSRPIVTCALTHALSVAGCLFLDEGDTLLLPDLYWGNYGLIFSHAWGARLATWPTFDANRGFDVASMRARLLEGPPGKRVVLLNFPNNPTGYTPTDAEADAIREALVAAAEAGNDVVVIIDDAYFGLVYADGVMQDSIFTRLTDAHERLLAVKLDGATKEDYVWGFRVGFVTYGLKGADDDVWYALESKTAGVVRGSVSNAPHVSQSLLLRLYESPAYAAQKASKYAVLRARYDKVRAVLDAHPEYAEAFAPLPFNSGYFMCVRPVTADAEAVRRVLLADFDTGVIATSGLLRLAFSATPLGQLEALFENVYRACRQVSGAA